MEEDKMNIKWQNIVVVISLLLNVVLVSFCVTNKAFGQGSGVLIPTLIKGTGYQVTMPNREMTCTEMENQLGLKEGDIESITVDPKLGTTIQFRKDVLLTPNQVQTATDAVKGMIPKITAK
jgi:hypothetical protein